ncbi:MAG: response regulator [Geobacteraceae bacterium]|nr:response regulator [Geobacteraceae bacterium]
MGPMPNRANARILVIDDEESILNLVAIVLGNQGYRIEKANDAFKGMEMVAAHNPSLVILDYMMPGMDGLQALKQIKSGYPDTYVIMFTGKGSEEIAVELMKAGASDYIIKPFSNKDLVERVQNVLKVRTVEISNRELTLEREQLLQEIKAWNEELELRIRKESEALKKAHAEVVQSQKLATLGYLAAGMAHEIRNPLNSIALFVQLIKEGVNDLEKVEYIEKILKEVDRVDATLGKLLDTARRPRFELAEVDIGEVIQKALDSFTPQINTQGIELNYSSRKNIPHLMADPAEIQQIFTNLLLNAVDEMPESGRLDIELDYDSNDIVILVSDSGRGIPEKHLPNIFDPFFTTKNRGTGMGLPIVLRIVKNYGGKIEITNTGNSGTTFLIRLPIA